jgi:hypothetical protein
MLLLRSSRSSRLHHRSSSRFTHLSLYSNLFSRLLLPKCSSLCILHQWSSSSINTRCNPHSNMRSLHLPSKCSSHSNTSNHLFLSNSSKIYIQHNHRSSTHNCLLIRRPKRAICHNLCSLRRRNNRGYKCSHFRTKSLKSAVHTRRATSIMRTPRLRVRLQPRSLR